MKKLRILGLVLAVFMLLSAVPFQVCADETQRIPGIILKQGDVNGDQSINIKDVTFIQKFLAKVIVLTDRELIRANVDTSGKLDVKDATHLQKWLAKLEEKLFEPRLNQGNMPATDDEPVKLPFIVAD